MRGKEIECEEMAAASLFALLALLGFVSLWVYNTVVARKNQVEDAFGGIEVQLKKRRNLVPDLVEAVKRGPREEPSRGPHPSLGRPFRLGEPKAKRGVA